MSEMLTNRSCEEFCRALASKEPVPGGGGAAALAGALAASLASMVANYTVGKPAYAAVDADVRRLLAEADGLRSELVALVDEDARAFLPLSQAYGMARDDPARPQVILEATKQATEPPLSIMRATCRVIDVLAELLDKGSRMLISDVGVGAHLARAALESASLNVYVNTTGMSDAGFAETVESECARMLDDYVGRADEVASEVTRRIRSKAS